MHERNRSESRLINDSPIVSRRKRQRFSIASPVDWDFFSAANGTKAGYLEDISEGGCLLRTTDLIDHRRWVRMVIKNDDLWFTCVGRVIRREDRMEPWIDGNITLHRYGVEFIHPVNVLALNLLPGSGTPCESCGQAQGGEFRSTGPSHGKVHCLRCHLRISCRNLLAHEYAGDNLEGA